MARTSVAKIALGNLHPAFGMQPREAHLGEKKAEQHARRDKSDDERRPRKGGLQTGEETGPFNAAFDGGDATPDLGRHVRRRFRGFTPAVEQGIKRIGWRMHDDVYRPALSSPERIQLQGR